MKKRTFVYLLIFAVCFSQLAAESVFGQEVTGVVFEIPARVASRYVVIAKTDDRAKNGIPRSATIVKPGTWLDLETFLALGGTIDLLPLAEGYEKNEMIISEIMWGTDANPALEEDPQASQWIELYWTGRGNIPAGLWTLQFTSTARSGDDGIDKFSNVSLLRARTWAVFGNKGNSATQARVPLVSMRRKIDQALYERIEGRSANADGLPAIPDGLSSDSWEATTLRTSLMVNGSYGNPGGERFDAPATVPSKEVVFNEIANRSNASFDWIELYNPGSDPVSINGWMLSKVTGVDKEDKLFTFDSSNAIVPAKGFLLVVSENPETTPLASGANIAIPNSDANALPTKFYLASELDIPEKDYLLILRKEGGELKSADLIVDFCGHFEGLLGPIYEPRSTFVWPLNGWEPINANDLKEDDTKTWVRDKDKDLKHDDAWKLDGDDTGLGIDRHTSRDDLTSGTPGFDNDAVKNKVEDLTELDPVVISEIMFGTGPDRADLPQWIELYNPSKTQAVNLENWTLEVQNNFNLEEQLKVNLNYTLPLPAVRIQPFQTVLIVSRSRGISTTGDRVFPNDRVISIPQEPELQRIIQQQNPRDAILSSKGFYMKLSDPDGRIVDQVGNLDNNRNNRDDPAWTLPGGNFVETGGNNARASMIRRKDTFGDGTQKNAWISANATADKRRDIGIKEFYYGDKNDYGTPGFRAGGPTPVQLSSFYSKRNNAGAVIITWATESELDNAGFNILRSVSRSGEFTKINAQLIPGAGTTGEKNTYTWTDTSAKPNVVYYYQIEDVSLDGEHRTLRTTRLRGYVGAAGKATTIWGELKSRD